MSKLTHIRKALQNNPNIKIVSAPERNYLPNRDGFWSHTVDFYVAPTGGVYTAKELQELMISVIPELAPTCKDDCRDWGHELQFGRLYFDEDIGTEIIRREIVLTDEDMFTCGGCIDGKRIIEGSEKVRRRTWVRVFPNVKIAEEALTGKNEYRISKNELSRHRSIFTRFFS